MGCGWATVLVRLTVDGDLKTDCTARIALPVDERRQPLDPPRRGAGLEELVESLDSSPSLSSVATAATR